MNWMDALGERAGPLLVEGARFASQRGAAPPPRGTAAMTALALWLDDYLDSPQSDDDAFVEGGGAFLGLALIDALGGHHVTSEGQHRVRLGSHGTFDPFGAIDAALEADEPRDALKGAVARAEREASGRGGFARVVAAFARVLQARPDVEVVSIFEHRVSLRVTGEPAEVDLARAASAGEGDDAALERAVARMLSLLPGATREALSFGEVRERVLPRLVSETFLKELSGQLYTRPLGHGVRVAYVIAYEGRSRYVTEEEGGRWEQLRLVALQNLAKRSAKASFSREETPDGPIVIAASRDSLDSARLLLPGVYDLLSAELGSPFVVSVPHRDILLASGAEAASGLIARAREAAARAPHAISSQLFVLGGGPPRPVTQRVTLGPERAHTLLFETGDEDAPYGVAKVRGFSEDAEAVAYAKLHGIPIERG